MLDLGEGAPAAPERALVLYKDAALKGHADAQNALATFFYRGELVPQMNSSHIASTTTADSTSAVRGSGAATQPATANKLAIRSIQAHLSSERSPR